MSDNSRYFLDTNILVYAFDNDEPEKQSRALEILKQAGADGDAFVISTQVLQEFYAVVTRKLARKLSEEDAERATRGFACLPVVAADAHLVLAAITLSRRYQLSLWDALIVQAASKAGCSTLLTEDLSNGMHIGRVRVEDPFLRTD